MSIFYDHLSDDEREMLTLENSLDLDMRKYGAMLTAVCESTAINMAEAENKVIMESGTTDDLDILYEAAATEGSEKTKGIFTKVFEAIKKFISNVKAKIKSVFTSEKAGALKQEKSVQDQPILDTVNGKLTGFLNDAKAKFAKLIHGGKLGEDEIEALKSKAKTIGVVGTAAGGAAIAGSALYNKIMKTSKEIDNAENACDAMMKLAQAGEKYENMKGLKGILDAVSEATRNSSSALFTALKDPKALASAAKDKVKETAANTMTKIKGKKDGEKVEESANDFDALLENYSYAKEDSEEEVALDGTVAGSFADIEKAFSIL